ncbi:hypothetical protein LJR255_001366 [Pararhizobium sp. LjRoot255]
MRVNAGPLAQALDRVQAAVFGLSQWLQAVEAISNATGAIGANIMEPTGRGAFGAAGYETVRSHIRSIFQKTGTGRQSELSALFGKIRL